MRAIFGVWLAVASLLALFLYGEDKRRARRGLWRIPEKTLLGIGILGGAAGALVGMKWFRHKTKHASFWIVNTLALVVQLLLMAALR